MRRLGAVTGLVMAATTLALAAPSPAGALPPGALYVVSVAAVDPATISIVVAVPNAPPDAAIPASAFAVSVDDQTVAVTAADPLPADRLGVALVVDDHATAEALTEQQAGLVDIVRRLNPATAIAVGTTSGLLVAGPSLDRSATLAAIGTVVPAGDASPPALAGGLFGAEAADRHVIALDAEPLDPRPSVAGAAVTVVRLHAGGLATVLTRPSPDAADVVSGPSTVLGALDQAGASLNGRYRLTAQAPTDGRGTLVVTATFGSSLLRAEAPVATVPPPTPPPATTLEPAAATTSPAPAPASTAPPTAPVATAPATTTAVRPASTVPAPTAAPARATPTTAAPEGPAELAVRVGGRGGADRSPMFFAGAALFMGLAAGVGVLALRRRPETVRVYVRAAAPYRTASVRPGTSRRPTQHR